MKYEVKKVINNKFLIIAMIMAIIASVYISLKDVNRSDNIKAIEANYDNPDSEAYQMVLDRYDSVNQYRDKIVMLSNRLMKSKDKYVASLNKKIKNKFDNHIEFKTVFSDRYLTYSIANSRSVSTLLFLSMFLVIAIYIFYVDVSNNMICMLRIQYRIRRIFLNKILVLLWCSIIFSCIKLIIDYLPMFLYGNVNDLINPIQCYKRFGESPYNINLIELILIAFCMMSIGFFAIGLIVVACANIFNKIQELVATLVLVSGVSYYSYMYITQVNYIDILSITLDNRIFTNILRRFTSVFELYDPYSYFEKAEYIRILDTPISLVTVTIVSSIVFIAVMICICKKLFLGRNINVRS